MARASRRLSLFLKLPYWGGSGSAGVGATGAFPLIKQGNFGSCCAAKLQLYIMRLSVCLRGGRRHFRALQYSAAFAACADEYVDPRAGRSCEARRLPARESEREEGRGRGEAVEAKRLKKADNTAI